MEMFSESVPFFPYLFISMGNIKVSKMCLLDSQQLLVLVALFDRLICH